MIEISKLAVVKLLICSFKAAFCLLGLSVSAFPLRRMGSFTYSKNRGSPDLHKFNLCYYLIGT
jgi:hypothetical protein